MEQFFVKHVYWLEMQETKVRQFWKKSMDDIANLVSISGSECPSNEYSIDKGPGWPGFDDKKQPIKIVSTFLIVHDLV